MKTAELIGPALDWAVAKCETFGTPAEEFGMPVNAFVSAYDYYGAVHYSTDWALGGPIIEREKIGFDWWQSPKCGAQFSMPVLHPTDPKRSPTYHRMNGSTPLIAAMRCFVASKLGDEVEIPEELK